MGIDFTRYRCFSSIHVRRIIVHGFILVHIFTSTISTLFIHSSPVEPYDLFEWRCVTKRCRRYRPTRILKNLYLTLEGFERYDKRNQSFCDIMPTREKSLPFKYIPSVSCIKKSMQVRDGCVRIVLQVNYPFDHDHTYIPLVG